MAEKKETSKRQSTVQKAVQAGGLKINLKDLALEKRRAVDPKVFAQWMRMLMQNWRQGTVACKARSDVSYANKKPWKQKGTGRARAGSARSPLWRGGGVTFGPQKREHRLKMPQQIKQRVLSDMLRQLIAEDKLYKLSFASPKEPKTRDANQVLKAAGLMKEVALLVDPQDVITQASFANIARVHLVLLDQLNLYDLASVDCVAILDKDFGKFKDMVSQWK